MSVENRTPPAEQPRALTPRFNPYVVAFIFGVFVLTVMPFAQRRFLKAPPPVGHWGEWQLSRGDAGAVSSAHLQGRVVLAIVVPAPCDAECSARLDGLQRAAAHLDDVAVARVVIGGVDDGRDGGAGWFWAEGAVEERHLLVARLRDAWSAFAGTDAGATDDDFLRLPAFLVVDQTGAVRGFWRDDSAGRGNAINAARLLATHGPTP